MIYDCAAAPLEDFENGYANELGTCWSGLDWIDRANSNPINANLFLRVLFSESDMLHDISMRATPMLTMLALRP